MLKKNENIIIKKRDDTYFGLNMETGTTYEMNAVQFDILNFFSGSGSTKEKLISFLIKKYIGDTETIIIETTNSIQNLLEMNVLIDS